MEFMKGSASASKVAKLFNPVKNHEVDIRNQTDYTKDRHEVKKHVYEYMNITESMPSARLDERESDTTKWTFDAFGREQEEQQQQHEARKERIFQNVLTALGCSAESRVALANELPPDVLRAWKTRADDKILVEARARDYNRKREVRQAYTTSCDPIYGHESCGFVKRNLSTATEWHVDTDSVENHWIIL